MGRPGGRGTVIRVDVGDVMARREVVRPVSGSAVALLHGLMQYTLVDECLCLHAEENALLEAGRERIGDDSVLYCNT